MYKLSCRIEIEGSRRWELTAVTSIEITRDTEKLTDECKITLPKKMKWDGVKEIPLERGNKVKV